VEEFGFWLTDRELTAVMIGLTMYKESISELPEIYDVPAVREAQARLLEPIESAITKIANDV
jgi:hypothetical protein